MSRNNYLDPVFVTTMPDKLENGKLYISMEYRAVMHKCACGCGEIVSTPLDPIDGWSVLYDGKTVSMSPSVGNKFLACKSHYIINKNQIIWCRNIDECYESSNMNYTKTSRKFIFFSKKKKKIDKKFGSKKC